MGSENRAFNIGDMAEAARAGWLYQVADAATATALVPAVFVLWNPGSKGLPLYVISARLSSDGGDIITLGSISADPAIGAGNVSSNLWIGQGLPEAVNEAAAIAAPTPDATLAMPIISAGNEIDLIDPGVILVPPGRGLVVFGGLVAQPYQMTWLWAEPPI